MRDLLVLLVHLITTVLRLVRPGGVRAVVTESLIEPKTDNISGTGFCR
jgi:hypothetical protein